MGQVNRATDVEAELVAMKRRRFRGALEEVASVKRAVTKELKTLAMIVVGTGARGDIHDRTGTAAVFRAER